MADEKSPVVLALCGPANSGKDTAGDALVAARGCVRVALGDGPKDLFDRLSGPTRNLHKEVDASGLGVRHPWVTIGTECRKDVRCHRIWSYEALIAIRYLSHYHPAPRRLFVVPDLRHLVEQSTLAAGVLAMGGRFAVARVDRPGLASISGHTSEHEYKQVAPDATVVNDSTIGRLGELVVAAFDRLLAGEIGLPRPGQKLPMLVADRPADFDDFNF